MSYTESHAFSLEGGVRQMDQLSVKIEELRNAALTGGLSRRTVLKRGVALGLSAPIIAGLLAACGGDDEDDPTATTGAAEPTPTTGSGQTDPTATTGADAEPTATEGGDAEPTGTSAPEEPTATAAAQAGGGGRLNLLNWQAVTILNPHLAQGGKDYAGASICMQALAEFDVDGNLVPILAAEIPSLENGGLAEDGTSVTWTLREGVKWHDGEDFTADDVVFTWQFAAAEDAATTSKSLFQVVESVEAVDDFTVTVTFTQPTPAWFEPFTTSQCLIIPEHALADYVGATAVDAPFNLSPIGTGPYMVTDFRPGDTVIYELFPDYWEAGKPIFDSVELKGGGDAVSAARASITTGEIDHAVNLQVEAEVLEQLATDDAPGELEVFAAPGLERLMINFTDPNTEVNGERSSITVPHPALSNHYFREAVALCVDRDTIATQLYGVTGFPTANIVTMPPRFASTNTTYTFDPEAAAAILDENGWTLENDVRTKDGYSCNWVYQTSTNTVRQKTQEIIKQTLESIGIRVEIKAIDAAVYFSSDAGNPDTYAHFYADLEMFTNSGTVFPLRYLGFYKSNEPETDIPQQSNNWSGRNVERWVNEEYNELWLAANTELDEEAQNELFIAMNDLIVSEYCEVAEVGRNTVNGKSKALQGVTPSPWATTYWDIQNWFKEE
jgi:peptide/nickel transport system substrate-binding protein